MKAQRFEIKCGCICSRDERGREAVVTFCAECAAFNAKIDEDLKMRAAERAICVDKAISDFEKHEARVVKVRS